MTEQVRGALGGALRKEVVATGKYSLIYLTGQALSRGIGFFMIPVYTRYIAPSDYGLLELIEIIISVVTIMMSLGVAEGLSRFYYGEKTAVRRNEVVSTVICGLVLASAPMVIAILLFSEPISKILLDGEQYSYFLQIAIGAAWFTMLCDLGLSYLRMIYQAKIFVLVTTIQLILALTLNIWFIVYCDLGILGIFYSSLISQAIIGTVLALAILCKTQLRFSCTIFREVVIYGIPLIPSRIGVMVGFMSNRFFLRWMTSGDPAAALTQIGLFSLGHKFGVVINRLFNAPFNSFWAPRRMELLLSDIDASQTVARICTYAVSCSLYLTLLLSAGVESLIEIMANPSYKGSHIVVPFVCLSYVLLGIEMHFSAGILQQKKTKWVSYITFLSVPIVLLWNYLLIPVWGLVGAATSNLAGGVVRVILIYAVSQYLYKIPYELGRLGKVFVASFVLYFIAQTIEFCSPWQTLFIRLLVVSSLPLLLYPMRFYHDGELSFARGIVVKVLVYLGLVVKKRNR